jgi:sodium-coupled neutral amino acid transporter 11
MTLKHLNALVSLKIRHLGLPYAVSQAGFVTGIVLLATLCAVTDWTIRLIVVNAKLSGRNSYIEIMNSCFGPSGRAAVSFFQFAFAFGGTLRKRHVSRNVAQTLKLQVCVPSA